jgi:hypothetical protein
MMEGEGFNTRLLERIEVLLGDRGPQAEPRRALLVGDKDALRAEFLPRPFQIAELTSGVAMAAAGTWVEALRLGLPFGTWAVDAICTITRASAATLDLAARIADEGGAVIHASAATCAPLAANRNQSIPLAAVVRVTGANQLRVLTLQAAIVSGTATDTSITPQLNGITGGPRATILRAWRIE